MMHTPTPVGTTVSDLGVRREHRREERDAALWPPRSRECSRKFGCIGRLYPFVGENVETDRGPGVLVSVFESYCRVLLHSTARQDFGKGVSFRPTTDVLPGEVFPDTPEGREACREAHPRRTS